MTSEMGITGLITYRQGQEKTQVCYSLINHAYEYHLFKLEWSHFLDATIYLNNRILPPGVPSCTAIKVLLGDIKARYIVWPLQDIDIHARATRRDCLDPTVAQ
jgi:hypothetical protein